MNGNISYDGMGYEADAPFNGHIAAIFTGSSNLGFLATFDLLENATQQRRYGAVLRK
jgi:hypothetical protein